MYTDVMTEIARFKAGRIHVARAGLATQARLCVDMLQQGRGMAWVVKNRDELLTARALMRLFSPELSSGDFLPDALDKGGWTSLPPFSPRSANREGWTERLSALYALRSGQAKGLILTADNLLPKLVPLDFFENREVTLMRGEDVSLDMILEQAVEWGYERVSMVSNPGEIARRGDILDIMPPGYDKPIRLDFFGDLIEEIRLFDPVSQRSKANLSEVRVLPVSPIRQSPADQAKMQARWKSLFQKNMLTENERFGLTRVAAMTRRPIWKHGSLPIPYGFCRGSPIFVICCPQRNVFGRKPSKHRMWRAVLSRSVWPCAKQAMWKALASGSPVFTQNRW